MRLPTITTVLVPASAFAAESERAWPEAERKRLSGAAVNWVQDRQADQQKAWAKNKEVCDSEPRVYDAPWEQVRTFVEGVRQESIEVFTAGTRYDRVVRTSCSHAIPSGPFRNALRSAWAGVP